MSYDKQQKPWWEDAQEYRSGTLTGNRRRLSERTRESILVEDPHELSVARRRRAAEARAAAQERRRSQSSKPVDFGWAEDSPFKTNTPADLRERRERAEQRAQARVVRQRSTATGSSVARRPGQNGNASRQVQARRQRPMPRVHPVARPERLLLAAAILGLFLVLAAASNSDAAVMTSLMPLGFVLKRRDRYS